MRSRSRIPPGGSRRSRAAAFTLIELLVALFVMAIMFAMGYGAINQAASDRDLLGERQERLTAVQRAVRVMTQDFAQLHPRPVRDRVGDGHEPALRADRRGTELVALTRSGWANPAGIQRPALQRVAYRLEAGTLYRQHWRVLDATLATEPVERELLDGVESLQLRFMDDTRTWREEWPPPGIRSREPLARLRVRPIAVEITLELEDWGRLVRIIEVGG